MLSEAGTVLEPKSVIEGEAKPEEVVKEPQLEKKEPVSPRFAAIARKEREILKRQQELKTEREAFLAEKARIDELSKSSQSVESLFKTDPVAAMEKYGWSYDKLTNFVLGKGAPTPEMIAEQIIDKKLGEFKTESQKKEEARLEAEKKKAQEDIDSTLTWFKGQISEFVQANPDDCELITSSGAEELVLQVIQEHFEQTKRVLSVKEAASWTERYLEGEVDKLLSTKKVKAKATPQPKEESKSSQNAQSRTLTNQHTTSAVTAPKAMSREERIKRALAIGKS